jgi:signal recognition particle receptor subunit beta
MLMQRYKIVFAGAMGAGKSQAIASLSDIPVLTTEAFNTDTESHQKMLTTVGIDYGEIKLDADTVIGLYGTPGQSRFDFIWDVISKGAIGIVILIDHSADNPLQDLDHFIKAFLPNNKNITIGITHVDEKPERPTMIYREWLTQQKLQHALFFIDARQKDDVLLMVETLIACIEIDITD